MNLKDLMLSEISQSQKDKYCMIPLMRDTQKQKVECWLPGAGQEEKRGIVV